MVCWMIAVLPSRKSGDSCGQAEIPVGVAPISDNERQKVIASTASGRVKYVSVPVSFISRPPAW